MDAQQESRDSLRVLIGLEDGNLEVKDCYALAQNLDDVILSLMFRYLRKKYPSSDPNASGVLTRVLEITSTYPNLVEKIKAGDEDPIREWFEETYSYKDYYHTPEDFIDLIIEKIES